MSEVIASELQVDPARIAVVSGPNLALEIAKKQPTAAVVASSSRETAVAVAAAATNDYFASFVNTDVIGTEFGGVLKNLIAVAVGIADGVGYGENTKAAIITRGLVEMSRLACAEGSRRETLAGLSGLGDLVLTCMGDLSRNRRVGIELGKGRALPDILSQMKMVAEGVRTTGAALALGARHGVELPLAAQMSAVLEGRTTAREAVEVLMLRPQRSETDHA